MIWDMILSAMKRRSAPRMAVLIIAVPALALSGCAAAGPPISIDRGDGEAVSVAAVDREDFVEVLGAVPPAGEAGEGESATGDGVGEQAPVYFYLIDPPLLGGTPDAAMLVSTSVLPAGSRVQLLNRQGTEVDSVRLPAVSQAPATGRRERVLHPGDAAGIRGLIVKPPPGWELPEPPETAGRGTPVASLSTTTRFFGAVLTADAVRLGAGSALSASRESSLEWTVELPADRMGSEASPGFSAALCSQQAEIDCVAGRWSRPAKVGWRQPARRRSGPRSAGRPSSSPGRAVPARGRSNALQPPPSPIAHGSAPAREPSRYPDPALGFVPACRLRCARLIAGSQVRRVQWHETTARNADINAPIPADLATVLSSGTRGVPGAGTSSRLFSWSAYPDIIVFDTADYETQAMTRLFKRLAFFVEKRGFRGRLLQADEELARSPRVERHNYRPEGRLSAFFTQAEAEAPMRAQLRGMTAPSRGAPRERGDSQGRRGLRAGERAGSSRFRGAPTPCCGSFSLPTRPTTVCSTRRIAFATA